MRLVFTGGGTGGHVYPALAVAAALREGNGHPATHRILYIGTPGGMEQSLVTLAGLPYVNIQAGAIRGRSLPRLLSNGARMAWGLLQALWLMSRFSPQAVLATGGYVCVPVVLAAWLLRIPSLLYLPDIEPGWAIRFLAYFASRIAVTAEKSKAFLPARKVVVTGYPVRSIFTSLQKAHARASLGLDEGLKTVLAWGGSRGARSINQALSQALPELLDDCQVVHVCGPEDEGWLTNLKRGLPEQHQRRYRLYAYLHDELPQAMAAADLAISRSGASVLGEFSILGLPSILVPYPYAGGHQRRNAQVMVEQGAAIQMDNGSLKALATAVSSLLNDTERLEGMRQAARGLARPSAAKHIASLLVEIAGSKASPSAQEHRNSARISQ